MLLVAGVVSASSFSCSRDSVDWVCPNVDPGDLVVTEIRGDQSGSDTYGEWLEIHNASAESLDLHGTQVRVQRLDGGAEGTIIIRSENVMAAPGDYLVIGRFAAGDEPAHVDYGYQGDFDSSMYNGGAVDISACGVLIDRVIYRDLPSTGTLSFDGSIDPPGADSNDDEEAWCVDDIEDNPDTTEIGIRGTPGEENRQCPE